MSQAAKGMEILGSAGKGTNEILDITPGLLTLMSAGTVDADVATKALTGTMAQFNLESNESNRIVDVFAEGAAIANTNVGELQEAFKMAGGDLAGMNMEIEQAGAMAGILANANIVGSQAGTTLSSMSREIKANSKDFKKLGIDVYDSAGQMRDMGSILTDVESKTGHMTDAQRDAALATIFTGQSMRGVNAFIAQGSDEYDKMADSLYNAEGAGLAMADTMEDNIGGAFRSLKSAGEGFLIDVGDVIKDDVRELAGLAKNLVKGFSKLDDGTKELIVKVGGLAMVTGPLLLGFSKLAGFATNLPGKIGVLKGAFGALVSPIGLAIGAIAGLIAVGVYLYKNNEEVREKIDTAWVGIKNIISTGVDFVTGLWDVMGEDIMNVAGTAWGFIEKTFMLGVDIIGGVVGIISSIIKGDWAGVWDNAKGIVVSVFNYFKGLPGQMFNIGKSMISSLGKGLKSVGTSAWNSTVGKIPGLKIDGSSASGENFIGKDGAIHKLHRREMILTGDTADDYRSLGGSKDKLPSINLVGVKNTILSGFSGIMDSVASMKDSVKPSNVINNITQPSKTKEPGIADNISNSYVTNENKEIKDIVNNNIGTTNNNTTNENKSYSEEVNNIGAVSNVSNRYNTNNKNNSYKEINNAGAIDNISNNYNDKSNKYEEVNNDVGAISNVSNNYNTENNKQIEQVTRDIGIKGMLSNGLNGLRESLSSVGTREVTNPSTLEPIVNVGSPEVIEQTSYNYEKATDIKSDEPNLNKFDKLETNPSEIKFSPEINVIVQGNADRQTAINIGKEVNKQLDLYFRKLNLQRG